MITSRAAVLREAGGPLVVEEVRLDRPGPGEVVARMVAASICHSDVHTITNGAPHLPMVIGHEAAGVVVEVGEGVTDLAPGDKVALSFIPSCGSCWACVRGLPVECERGSAIGSEGRALDGTFKLRSAGGEEVGQMVRLGAFSEHVLVHRDSCVKVPDDADLEVAALMSCGFVTGAGAVVNIAGTRPGDSVVVVGTGGVGIAAIQGAVLAGAAKIVAVDVNPDKLEVARSFGATHVVDATDQAWPDAVVGLLDGRGADQGVSAIGSLSDDHLAQFMASLRSGGTGVLVGAGRAQLDVFAMGRKTVTRTLYGSFDPKADQLRFLDLYTAGRIKAREMITRTYSLDEANEAIADLHSGKNIRGVIRFDEVAS